MDISSFTESLLEDLPTKYILALVRGLAMRGDTSGQPGAGNWTAVADEFYRVVTRYVHDCRSRVTATLRHAAGSKLMNS